MIQYPVNQLLFIRYGNGIQNKKRSYLCLGDHVRIASTGESYAVDASDKDNIRCHALKGLATLANDEFDFIMRYLESYSHNDAVAELDDLDCLIGNECDEEKLTRLTEVFGSDDVEWKKQHDDLLKNLFERAIKDYRNQ